MKPSQFKASYHYYLSSYARQWLSWALVALIVALSGLFYLLSGSAQATAFSGTSSFFGTIALVSLLVLPVLSIRAETPQVSFEQTFPMAPVSRILGEVFALETLYAVALSGTILLLPLAARLVTVEAAPCSTSYVALLFYGLSIISFCLWISRFFSNTVFSYLVTAALLFFCNTVHLLPTDAAWIKTVSFIWHFDSASKGIIATKDLVFFIAVSAFSICATLECETFRKNPKKLRPLQHLLLEAVLCLLIAGNARVYNLRLDTTADKRFSLSSESLAIIEQVNAPLHITWYVSKTILNRYPQADDIRHMLNQYADASVYISVSVVSDPDEIAEANLGNLGITPQSISTASNDETRTLQVYSAMVLDTEQTGATIPFVLSNTSLEYDLTFRIRTLLAGQAPIVAIVNGTGLELDTCYSYLSPWISSSGMVPVELTADMLSQLEDVDRCVLLVIGSETLTSSDVESIDHWIMAGKPALFAVSTVSVDISSTWQAQLRGHDALYQLLDYYGVQLADTLVCSPDCFTLSLYSSSNQSSAESILYPYWVALDTAYGKNLQLFWPTCLTLFDTEVCSATAVAEASADSVLVSAPFVTSPFAFQDGIYRSGVVVADSGAQVPVAALLEGKLFSFYQGSYSQNNRVMVIADQYFLSNMVENTGSGQNFSFLISSLLYLNGDEDLMAVKARWE